MSRFFSPPPMRQLVPGLIFLVAALGLAAAFFIVRPHLLALTYDNTRTEITYHLNRLQGTFEYLLARNDLEGVQREVASNSTHRDLKSLLVVDASGTVIAASELAWVGQPLRNVGLHFTPELLPQVIESKSIQLERRALVENTLYGVAPLRFPDARQLRPDNWGAIVIELDLNLAKSQLMLGIEEIFLWIAVTIFVSGVLVWYGFDRLISRRLQRIGVGIEALERGRFDRPVELEGRDELAQIAAAMNQLAGSLQRSRDDLIHQHNLFDSVMRHIPALVSIVDADGRFRFVNARFIETYGLDPSREQLNLEQTFPAELAARHRELNAQVLDGAGSMQLEMSTRVREAKQWWFMVKFPLAEQDARVQGICTVSVDVTDQEQNQKLVRLSQQIFEHTAEGIFITDREQRIVEVNSSFERISGYAKHELLGQTPALFRSLERDDVLYAQMWLALTEQGHWQGEIVNRRRDGTQVPVRLSVSTITDPEHSVTGYFAIYQDIRAEKRAERALRDLAYHDTLTGLYNRASFKQKVNEALVRLRRFDEAFGVLFIDLDRFKEVNDTLGHEKGDELLTQVARRIESHLRTLDQACRLGGDEFTVLVPHVSEDSALGVIAEKLIDSLGQPFRVGEQEVRIGCSIGIVVAPRDGQEIDTLMRYADAAMYHAKDSGRGRYAFFDASINDRNQRLMAIKQGLRQAAHCGELSLTYQPELDPISGEIRTYEALMRWNSQALGFVSPTEFIAVAEESDLIAMLTRWLIQQVAQDSKHPALAGCRIGLNISPRQFRSESWIELIREAMAQHDLDPHRLCVEVTESALVEDFVRARAQLQALQQIGVEIAIDDFGTGYSSLAYLKRLPINYLKIDRSFVADIGEDPDDQTIVSTIIVMAHELGIRVIAEGAETAQQVRFLKQHGCDLIQGYFYARPLPLGELSYARHSIERQLTSEDLHKG